MAMRVPTVSVLHKMFHLMVFGMILVFSSWTISTEFRLFSRNRLAVQKSTNYYWNIPTFQCDWHKLNFTGLAKKYGIIQNENDRFWGDQISILYDPGNFPAILRDNNSSKVVLRNGGVPQRGNLTRHLERFQTAVEDFISDPSFSGLAVIDFESWRPVYRQNFGVLTPYKDLSVDIEKNTHPFWPSSLVEKEATRRFESNGRLFMQGTIQLGKLLRPNATWGFYAYPYCFNMAPKNMRTECPVEVQKENDKVEWLFNSSDSLHPSLYLSGQRLNAKENLQMIEGRLDEALRVASFVKKHRKRRPQIYPYIWYKYQDDSKTFLSKEDLTNALLVLSTYDVDGVILWGSSNDVNTKSKCLQLYDYIDNVLGPTIIRFR